MHSLNPHLVFTRDSRERKQALSSFGVTIGRGKECDLQIDDRRISMQHCRLFFNNGEWCVADLKSANRTFVNDELVLERPRKIADGDVLRFGSKEEPLFEARFVAHEVVPPVVPPDPPPQPPDSVTPAAELESLRQRLAERETELARVKQLYVDLQGHAAERDAALASGAEKNQEISRALGELRDQHAQLRIDHDDKQDQLFVLRGKYVALDAQLIEYKKHSGASYDDSESRRRRAEKDLAAVSAELELTQRSLEIAQNDLEAVRNAHNALLRELDKSS